MITDPIASEVPAVHWQVLGHCIRQQLVKGNVLDLGCGWHDDAAFRELGVLDSTPSWWDDLSAGTLGVDCNENHVCILREHFAYENFVHASVTAELVAALMQLATYVKCDIEGAESELFRVPIMPHIQGVAVECHNASLLAECRLWCRDGGLTIIAEQPLAAHPRIVVVTAVRVDA